MKFWHKDNHAPPPAAAPGDCLSGRNGAVERPRGSKVQVVGDPFRWHVALDERKAGSGIAPAVPLLLPRRALLLKYDGPRARRTAITTSSEVVEDAPRSFMITGGSSSFIGRRLQRGGDEGLSMRAHPSRGRGIGGMLTPVSCGRTHRGRWLLLHVGPPREDGAAAARQGTSTASAY